VRLFADLRAAMPERALQAVWIVWWLSWWAAAAWSDRAAQQPARRSQIVYRIFAGAGVLLLFGMYRHQLRVEMILWRTPPLVAWAMVALAVAGLLFTWWARVHLGRLWSASVGRKADHHVVDTGPYAIVRHPIYTGIIVASTATAALRGTLLSWIGACVMTMGWVIKARMEEKFLREQLGAAAYDEYARRVPMLSPLAARRRDVT
jgi:protein-S-isoprenylcysteine O-methyltransferase Ste14